ncbi:MAG: DUF1489 domain-containing protein [Alphaproteobacteria bacterium]|nr:DUF1489 domain-containing protein [Alphaproteobacteria bacterium]
MTVNLLKLSVGSESVESLAEWQAFRLKQVGRLFHTTRMRPRRREEVLDGGSIFWVIKGMILCRQKVTDLEEFVDDENISRCRIMLDKDLVAVRPIPRRAFQGWRYFDVDDAPPDLSRTLAKTDMPPEMRHELAELGLL